MPSSRLTRSKPHARRRALSWARWRKPLLELLEARYAPAVSVVNSFATGLNLSKDGGADPPDPQGAVGPICLVTTIYSNDQDPDPGIAIFPDQNSSAGAVTSTMVNFWTTNGGLQRADPNNPTGGSYYHPTVLWDAQIQRFIIGESDLADATAMGAVEVEDIAVSKSDTPQTLTTADWAFYQIKNKEINPSNLTNFPGEYDADTGNWGYNADEVVYTESIDETTDGTTTTPVHRLVVAINQNDLENAVNQASLRFTNTDVDGTGRLRPAVMHDSNPGDPMWFVSTDASGTAVDVTQALNLLGVSPNITTTTVGVKAYQDPGGGNVQPQGPGGKAIDGGDDGTILSAAVNGGKLVATGAVTNAADDRSLVRWYEIDLSGAAPSLFDQGEVDDATSGAGQAGVYDMYPSIDINSQGDLGLTYVQSGTGANQYLSMYVTGRGALDPKGALQVPVEVAAGAGNPPSTTPQGTYSGISTGIDGSFWATNYLLDASGVARSEIAHFNVAPAVANPQGNWIPVGPAPIAGGQTSGLLPVSGRVTGVATDPKDTNTIFIATAGGGVWRTTNAYDATPTWTPLTDHVTVDGTPNGAPVPMFMGAIAETRDQNGNEIVYAGTGEPDNTSDSYYGKGILISLDGGSTWSLQDDNGTFRGAAVAKIVIDPSDPTGRTIYAAIDDNGQNSPNKFVSTGIYQGHYDDTQNKWLWKPTTTSLPGVGVFDTWSDLVIDPKNSELFAAVGNGNGGGGNGIYFSPAGGQNWQPISNLAAGIPFGNSVGRISLAIYDDGTTQELVAATADPNTKALSKMFKLTVVGGEATLTDLTKNVPNYLGTQGQYDNTLAISPNDPNFIYAAGDQSNQNPAQFYVLFGSGSPLASFDGGTTWHDISSNTLSPQGPHSDTHAAAFDLKGNLIEGDDGGVYRLSNPRSNSNWTSLNTNLQITQFESIAVDPKTPNVYFGGSQDNGTEAYTAATGWTNVLPGDGGVTRVDPTNSQNVYASIASEPYFSYSGGLLGGLTLLESTNGGSSFPNSNLGKIRGMKETDQTNNGQTQPTADFYPPYVLDSSGAIYYGTDYLNYSNNQGSLLSWKQLAAPGQDGFSPPPITPIDDIALSSDSKVIYLAVAQQIWVSQPSSSGTNGLTWSAPANSPKVDSREGIAVDPSHPNVVYAVYSHFAGTKGNHVFKSINSGASWTDISTNLPDIPVDSIALSGNGATIFIGTDVGVYSTSDAGGPNMPSTPGSVQWTSPAPGLPNVRVEDIEVVPSQNLIAVGTHGRGMWILNGAGGLAPIITSTNTTTMTVGKNGSFNVTTYGIGTPTITSSSDLPSYASLSQNGTNANLTVNPPAGSGGVHTFTISVANGTNPAASQAFNLIVNEGPTFTSGATATFTPGVNGQFKITTTPGYPNTPIGFPSSTSFRLLDPLPAGLTLTDNGDGTATISGMPQAGTANANIVITATNRLNGITNPQGLNLTIGSPLTASQRYVTAVYRDVLGRASDAAGLAYWSGQIDAGAPASGVAQAIGKSDEYYANLVIRPNYLKLLGRAADAGGVTYWTGQMDAGTTDQQLQADLVASDEFYAGAGGTDSRWIGSVYELLLGRTPDSGGMSYWSGQLAAGQTRNQVAQGIAGSQENNTQLINDDYFHYLVRAADSGGLAFWLGQFASGATNEDVIAGFTGSAEYYTKNTTS